MAFVIGKYDEVKQTEGVWVDYEGTQLLVASAQSTKFTKVLNRIQKKLARQIQQDPSVGNKAYLEAMAEAMLLDWKEAFNAEGEKVPYSKETALEALTGDPELRDFVSNTAVDNDLYQKELIKAKAKK